MVTTLLTVLALAGGTQAAEDPRWLAYEGCWRPAEDAAAPLMCIRQADAGVVLATYVEGELKSQQRITADGTAHPISEGGCSGQETARWSADGARVYLRATLSCGTGMERLTTSALALTSSETLVEVQSLRVGEGSSVRSVRYQLVPAAQQPAGFAITGARELARETGRLQASAALDIADVIEGSQQLDAGALEALLAARQAGFALNAQTLKQLAGAGVPRSTLDVMVGLSYPQKFQVAEADDEDRGREWVNSYYDPYYRNPGYQYDCLGLSYYSSMYCDYRYGYSPYSYSRYGGYGYYGSGYYGGGPIIVVPGNGDGGDGVAPRGGTVSPDGYNRGTQPSRGTARRRNDPSDNGARSSVQPGRSSGGSSTAAPSSSGSTSRGGSVSSGGYSSGGGASKSSGTARPRG